MDKDYIIFQENDLFGAKNQIGEVIIEPQYIEMKPFCCGLAMVRDSKYRYGYVNIKNEFIIPLGSYAWCDPFYVCGFACVIAYTPENNKKWGIIDTLGNVVVPLIYDNIWPLKENKLFSCKAFMGSKEIKLNLNQLAKNIIFDGLTYLRVFSIEEFKALTHCDTIKVIQTPDKNVYITYGANVGATSFNAILKEPVIAIVMNSSGKLFSLLMEKSDIGKPTLPITQIKSSKVTFKTHSSGNYETRKMNDYDNWTDPYGDEQAYYDGWSREDVESGLADAYEGDMSARWNND